MTKFYDYRRLHENFEGLDHKVPEIDLMAIKTVLMHSCSDKTMPSPVYAEIGTFCGASACFAAKTLLEMGWNKPTIVCIDPWGEGSVTDPHTGYGWSKIFSTFMKNAQLFPKVNWKVYRTRSDSILNKEHPNCIKSFRKDVPSINVGYIDGDHTKRGVLTDYSLLWEAIAPGGMLIGHDYATFDGVTEAAEIFGIDGIIGTTWLKYKELHRVA